MQYACKVKNSRMQNKDFILHSAEHRRWVALSAIYSALNGMQDDTLTGQISYASRNEVAQMYQSLWGVPVRKRNFLKELLGGRIEEHVPMLDLLNSFAKKKYTPREKAGLAWDTARYAICVRDAFFLGYITKETALHHLEGAHRNSRGSYSSWQEFADCFIAAKKKFDRQGKEDLAI